MSRVISLTVAFTLLGTPAGVSAQRRRLVVPRALREGLRGCLSLPGGETYVIEPAGERGLDARWQVAGPNRRPESHRESMRYRQDLGAVESGCGARSQHGQYCLFTLDDAGSVQVTRVSRYSGRTTRLEVHPCPEGTSVREPERSPASPIPDTAAASALLGARRRRIDAGRTPTGEEAGWTRYGDDLAIQYERGVAMRVRLRVGALSCEDAARRAGYQPSADSAPLRRRNGCEWPGVSRHHRLAPHVAALYADGTIELRRRP